jgi:RNA polymerase sigma-70 factor (ECF subfamily)
MTDVRVTTRHLRSRGDGAPAGRGRAGAEGIRSMVTIEPTTPVVAVVSDADAISFMRARPRLVGVARRVLGNAADADDVVQDAWMRWQKTDRSTVRDPAAFLATTTMRLALNVGQSARVRRETAFAPQLVDAVDPDADPALGAEQRQVLEQALRTVLESLSPSERGVYVLREAFDYPHRRIAKALGLTEANARQLVTRARHHVSREPGRPVNAEEHRRLVEVFVAAEQTGDLAALEQHLAAGIAGSADRLEGGSRVRVAA